MTNPYRGEVSVMIAGVPRAVVYDWDAVARLVEALGPEFDGKIAEATTRLDLEVLAEALVIGLQRDWPEADAATIRRASPPIFEVQRAIGAALNLAFHGREEGSAQPPENPPTRAMNGNAATSLLARAKRLFAPGSALPSSGA